MKKILVPIDFSDQTDINCKYALELAVRYGSEILLYHTWSSQVIFADSAFPDTIDMNTIYQEEVMKDVIQQANDRMAELKQRISTIISENNYHQVIISTQVSGGYIDPGISDIVDEFRPDLVVIGAKGEGKTLNPWGSVATFLINHLTIPILVIPEIKIFMGFQDIMVALDLSEGNDFLLKATLEMFMPFRPLIKAVHFLLKKLQPVEEETYRQLQTLFNLEIEKGMISFEMVETEQENQKAIDAYINSNNIKLIVFQPHKHTWLFNLFTRNITRKNLFQTNIPLLAISAGK